MQDSSAEEDDEELERHYDQKISEWKEEHARQRMTDESDDYQCTVIGSDGVRCPGWGLYLSPEGARVCRMHKEMARVRQQESVQEKEEKE